MEETSCKSLIEAVPRWYEDEKASPFSERAWRDPYVMHYEPENVFYAFITARTKQGPVVDRGCIALARSSDLVDWEVFPPVQLPQTFMQLEVPQCVVHQGMCCLLFSVNRAWYTSGPATQASAPRYGNLLYGLPQSFRSLRPSTSFVWGRDWFSLRGQADPSSRWWLGHSKLAWPGQNRRVYRGLSDPKAVCLLPNGAIEVA